MSRQATFEILRQSELTPAGRELASDTIARFAYLDSLCRRGAFSRRALDFHIEMALGPINQQLLRLFETQGRIQ